MESRFETYGDFLNFNPHLHAVTTDGCFLDDGSFKAAPGVMPNDMSSKESRQNWARLIQKIYEVDPLLCPKCQGTMKIIAFIEELDIIEKILRHLGLRDIRNNDPPQKVSDYDYILELVCQKADPRIPFFESWY